MDYRKLTDADLADFAKNLAERLAEHAVASLDNTLQDTLAATLDPLYSTFDLRIENGVKNTAIKQSAIADKQIMREDLLERLATVRNYLVATTSAKTYFELCGFTYPKKPGPVIAQAPTNLSASGSSNGVNRLTFNGNNKLGTVVYEMWRLNGDTAPWGIIGTTRRQAYYDTPVVPGEYYNYKVRAVAATNTSDFSNVAVVYGSV